MRYKVIEHKTSGIEEIVNPIAPYARSLRDRALVIDTETTGGTAEDEVVELAIVRPSDGKVLFDGMFRPSKQIEYFAHRVHRIRDIDLRNKPRIGDLWDTLNEILDGKTCLAWNSVYDSRLLSQSFRKYGLPEPSIEWVCLMKLYKEFKGLPKVCKLEDACRAMGVRQGSHRAVTDALAAARVLYKIAGSSAEDEVITYDHTKTEDFDETTMPAGAFLAEFGWKEKKHLVTRAGEDEFIESDWMDPKTGEIYGFLDALECQRERMMKQQSTTEVVN